MVEMVFREETVQEFNSYRDTTLTEKMTFYEALIDIEKANNNYFYVSMNINDVIEAVNDIDGTPEELNISDKVYLK